MAELVTTDVDTRIATFSRRSVITVAIIGALVGLLTWLLVLGFERLVIQPLFCTANSFAICANGGTIASNLATIFATVFGAFALVRYAYYRPLVIAIAAACILWGLTPALGGLSWYEGLIWTILLAALTYVTFAWLTRLRHFVIMLVIVAVAVVAIRLITLL